MKAAQKSVFPFQTAVSLARACLVLLGLSLLPGVVSAQPMDTLDKLRKTKVLLVGVRDKSLPFSTLTAEGASGYSVEVCNKVAEQLRKELKLPELKNQYVTVTAANRMAKLKDGSVDIECGNTVNTKVRQAEVDFSYTFFVAGERILVRQDSGVQDLSGLAGKSLGVVKGSTAETIFNQLKNQVKNLKLEFFTTGPEAFAALEAGKIPAMAQPDILLESMRAQSGNPNRYMLTADTFSVEPMAVMVRKGDPAFRALVDKTVAALFASGEITGIYNKWFLTNTLKVPMSLMLKDCITRPSREPGVALGVGYSL
ncbi:amino acid ABC transporter substrate-binding protein [Uliginosibacterium gangwonense]|uniref:amino acid ABC transporter substrate-binding protein n=1 Tax=Uliginosibacterium gangwonense TaxID=392736 RepID=UPI0012F7E96D|nr:amino acid ABC transporter substrate-binding protein [Uliginosibacterium gangwonense]